MIDLAKFKNRDDFDRFAETIEADVDKVGSILLFPAKDSTLENLILKMDISLAAEVTSEPQRYVEFRWSYQMKRWFFTYFK